MEITTSLPSSEIQLGPLLQITMHGLIGLLVMVLSVRTALRRKREGRPHSWVPLMIPSAVFLGLFTSFGVHMFGALGGWPESIGTHGFPEPLIVHGDIASFAFGALLLGLMVGVPVGLVGCAAVDRLRSAAGPLGIYVACNIAALVLMHTLAPGELLDWWWD